MWSVHDADTGQLVGFVMISDDIPQASSTPTTTSSGHTSCGGS